MNDAQRIKARAYADALERMSRQAQPLTDKQREMLATIALWVRYQGDAEPQILGRTA